MLSNDEVVPDADEADEIKDFAYYAELAEDAIENAERWTEQFYNPRLFEHALKAADVFARLAAAAPTPSEPETIESRMIYLHADNCPCIAKG